ncbi:sugar ABC transporter substrate-binding protein [Brevirhabdus sp.]|uniref:sugar ABC transporter substrate-binding protein n=1 Tax=Brevirhabdus sp. TaxID=2004514 RepID=UPI0040595E95
MKTFGSVMRGVGLALGAALAGAAGVTGALAQEKEIAVMLPAAGDPYFKMKSYGYIEEGKKRGYKVEIYDAGGYGNLQKQVSQIEDVIQRKVAGIVLVPASSDGTVPVVEKAIAAGVPVVNDGIATKTDKISGFVGEPSYVMTELLAAYAVDKLGGKGDVILLSGPSGLDLTRFRVDGFKDYIAKYPDMKVVAEKFTSTSSAEALTTMQDFLQSRPTVKVVYAFNGPIAIGAVQALRAAGKKPGDVMILTTDMEPETRRLIEEGWIDATVVSQPVTMARLAVQRAIEASEGQSIPAETLTQASLISKTTLDAVDLSGQAVPDDWK